MLHVRYWTLCVAGLSCAVDDGGVPTDHVHNNSCDAVIGCHNVCQ